MKRRGCHGREKYEIILTCPCANRLRSARLKNKNKTRNHRYRNNRRLRLYLRFPPSARSLKNMLITIMNKEMQPVVLEKRGSEFRDREMHLLAISVHEVFKKRQLNRMFPNYFLRVYHCRKKRCKRSNRIFSKKKSLNI